MRGLVLLPDFLSQMNAFVVDRQMIVAPEALATFFALVGLLTCDGTAPVKHQLRSGNRKQHMKGSQTPYRSGFSDAWSGDRGG